MNDTEQIEKYFAGELSKEALHAFEIRLQANTAFTENFKLYQAIEKEMNTGDDEATLKEKLSGCRKNISRITREPK